MRADGGQLRGPAIDSDRLPDALCPRQDDAGTIDPDRLGDTIRKHPRDAGADANSTDDAARRAVGAARQTVPNISELSTGVG